MKVVVGGRRTGKTTALIRLAAEHGAYMVVGSRTQAANLARQAKAMGLDIRWPITYGEMLRPCANRAPVPVVIDEAGVFLDWLAGAAGFGKVVGLSVCSDDEQEEGRSGEGQGGSERAG